MNDLSMAVARILVAHREQYPLATGGLAPCVTCRTPYPCRVAEALEPARRILATPICQDCGMRHAPGDNAACIEGHGDDPVHPFNPDPVKPLCTDCDEPEAFHYGFPD